MLTPWCAPNCLHCVWLCFTPLIYNVINPNQTHFRYIISFSESMSFLNVSTFESEFNFNSAENLVLHSICLSIKFDCILIKLLIYLFYFRFQSSKSFWLSFDLNIEVNRISSQSIRIPPLRVLRLSAPQIQALLSTTNKCFTNSIIKQLNYNEFVYQTNWLLNR